MNQSNVIAFPVKEENFDEKIQKIEKSVASLDLSPDKKILRELFNATMDGDDKKRAEILQILERKKKANIQVAK